MDKISKPLARERGYVVRMGMSVHEQSELDDRIFAHLKNGWDWNSVVRVHVYLPLAKRREIGTWDFVRWIWAAHPAIDVYAPRITATGLEHVAISHETRFKPNHYQIPEPQSGHILEKGEKIDAVITPLLAYDGTGNRVGYGGGYYDRFLAQHREARRIGLSYSACQVPEGILVESFDVPMDAIVTENGIISTRQQAHA